MKTASNAAAADGELAAINKLPGDQRLRAQVKFLEPAAYVKTYTVDPHGSGGAYRTLKACYAAIEKDKRASLGVGAFGPQSNPWDWRKVEVAAGTYRETLSGVPPHVALVGMGKKPEETHFITSADVDTLGTTGRSVYVSNMVLEQRDANPDSHPLREQGQSGDAGLGPLQRRTLVFDRVRFVSGGGGAWGKSAADIMPGPGTALVFHSCTFEAAGQQQQVNVVTNSHETDARSDFFFLGCTIAGNTNRAGNNDSTLAFPVGAPDFSAGHHDTFVWMDGHWNLGSAVPVGALLAFPCTLDPTNGKVTKKNPTTQYVVVNPGAMEGVKATAPDGVLPVLDHVPAGLNLPVAALSAQEAEFFGVRPSAQEQTLDPVQQAAGTIQVKAGDMYWVAVDLGPRAACARAVALSSGGEALAGAAITLAKSGKPDPDGNVMTTGKGATGGRVAVEAHWYYPGQAPFWVGVTFAKDAAVPAMKAAAGTAFRGPTGADASSVDGLSSVPVGTLVPRPSIVSQWTEAQP